mgnify:CR=1 FL=1
MIMAYGQISKVKLDKTEPNIRLNNVKFKNVFFLHIEFNRLSIFILIFFISRGCLFI